MKRRSMRQALPALVLAVASLDALADGGQECLTRRARTPAEAKQAQDIIAALKAALPDAPPPWQRVDVTEPRKPSAQIGADPGCGAEAHSIKAAYRNDTQALAAAQALQANLPRIEALTAEMQAAIAKGDHPRTKALGDELARLQSGGGNAMSFVTIEVNGSSNTSPPAGAQPLAVPGAAQAYGVRSGPQPRVVMLLGDTRRTAAASVAQARRVVVTVDGDAAEALARQVKLGDLQALLH